MNLYCRHAQQLHLETALTLPKLSPEFTLRVKCTGVEEFLNRLKGGGRGWDTL